MKVKKIFPLVVAILTIVVLQGVWFSHGSTSPLFYLATDKSFSSDETPYVNLEGPGDRDYEFRIYKIENPGKFIKKSVTRQLVKEKNDTVYGNPIAIFKDTYSRFKTDFRKVARRELNHKTRSHLMKSAGVDYTKPDKEQSLAIPGLLKNHTYLFSFSIPKSKSGWSYRRVPIPVKEKGVYLIEGLSGANLSYTMIIKSNINFVTKQSDNQTLVYVAFRDTGDPVAQAKFNFLNASSSRPFYSGNSDKKGILLVNKRTPEKTLIIAKHKDEYAVSDPNFYAKSFYGSGGLKGYVYTERPIYKPGDDVFFKGIVRKFSNNRYYVAGGNSSGKVINSEGKTVIDNIPIRISNDVGTFSGDFKLPKNNLTLGVYNFVARKNDQTFSTEFSVEEYKKPEFLVKVKTLKRTYNATDKIDVTISANYYYGGPVASADVNYKVFRQKKYTYSPVGQMPYFEIDPAYLGLDQSNQERELILEEKAKLDSEGRLSFSITPEDIDDDYRYIVIASAYTMDSTLSGSTSFSVNRSEFFIKIAKSSSIYNPGDSIDFAAVLSPFDKSMDEKGIKSAVAARKIEAVLYTRGFTSISSEKDREKITSQTVTTDENGKAKFSFKIPKKGHYIIVCTSEDRNSKETTALTTFWASAKTDTIQVPFKNLTLKSKKDMYATGDYAEVMIMSPVADGTFFITLEGNKILKHETVKIKGNTYKYRVRINQSMVPNFTVSVLQFAGNDVYQNQVKVVVPPFDKFIKVKVSAAKKVYKPGETAVLSINTKGYKNRGVSSEVSIAVVDEAVYQLQEDKNPPVPTYFYHPRRNNVNTTLSTAYRFFGYSEAKRLQLALQRKKGTLLAAIKDEEAPRENYKDTCYWKAKVITDRNGRAKVRVPLADNITTWRVTAVALTRDTRVGQGKTKFIARKKLMVKPGVPTYMIKGKKQRVSANIVNLTKKPLKTNISLSAKGLKIVGDKVFNKTVEPNQTLPVYFTVIPNKNSTSNSGKVYFKVKSDKLSDSARLTIPLKNFGIAKSISSSIKLNKDETKKISLKLPKKSKDKRLEIRLSLGIGEGLRQSLSYLVNYPYGCVEQTMSRFMPLLAARRAGFISPKIKRELPKMVDQGIVSIGSNQNQDGGFGWFTDKVSDPLMTAYVYRGLALSKKLYNKKNNKMMADARRFLFYHLSRNNPKPFVRAYILYSLSEGGKIEKSMLRKLEEVLSSQNEYGKTLTALTLINHGRKKSAEKILDAILDNSEFLKEGRSSPASGEYDWHKDSIETAAALLMASVRLDKDEDISNGLASYLLESRNGIAWKNSRDTAMAVLALSEHLGKIVDDDEETSVIVKLNGTIVREFTASSKDIEKSNVLLNISRSDIKSSNKIEITKEDGVPVYAVAILHYTDSSDSFNKTDSGFDVTRKYYKMEGEKDSSGSLSFEATKTTRFKPGDLVMAELEISSNRKGSSYVMLEDPVPPGFAVVRKDTEYFSNERKKEYESLQIFFDKVACFRTKAGKFTIRYFLRANIPGKYEVLPAKASLMYYPEIYGTTSDQKLSIEE